MDFKSQQRGNLVLWTAGGVALLLSQPGCGLLYVPYLHTYPEPSLRQIEVRDFESQQPVDDATISFTLTPYENRLPPETLARWGVGTEPESIAIAPRAVTRWASSESKGTFHLEPETKLCWYRLWLPLPPVRGNGTYHCYDGILKVAAPGHDTVWLGNYLAPEYTGPSLGVNLSAENGNRQTGVMGWYIRFVESGVHVYLPRLAPDKQNDKPG